MLAQGSVMNANQDSTQLHSRLDNVTVHRLSTLSVLSQEEAQIAIDVAGSALTDLDKVRSNLGSIQNQILSTIANISTTKVNIFASESLIRDADLSEESSQFSKLQVLMEVGTFALAQANSTSKNLLNLIA